MLGAMSPDQIAAFLLFAVVAAITPGPSNVLLAATGGTVGLRRGLPCLAGVLTGMSSLIVATALGLGGLLAAAPVLMPLLRLLGAGFLLWLAWRIATATTGSMAAAPPRHVGFAAAALLQWVNPKAWLAAASAVAAHLPPGPGGPLWLVLLFVVAALPCGLLWLGLGSALQRRLGDPVAARRFNRAMGAALALSVGMMIV